mmetsp:Transcript_128919/g.325307  ORF Transcript_128919/g.325307 Transcript_128919/m.325307 type:complete len:292 (-) Transcript_128919:54-929(-)
MRTLPLFLAAVLIALAPRLARRRLHLGIFSRRLAGEVEASTSCQAAALGAGASKAELEAVGRPLPAYMLQAEHGDEARALVRWVETLEWRCEVGDEAILARPHPNFERIVPHYPQFLHLPDREGRLTYWELVGKLDQRAMMRKGLTPDDLFEHYIWSTFFTWDVAAHDDAHQVTVIADFRDFQLSVMTPTVMKVFMRVSKLLRTHFPAREHGIFVINAPPWIERAYRVVRPLISQAQRDKVRVIQGEEASLAALHALIDPANLPAAYGGTGPDLGLSPLEKLKRELALGAA